jgi:hypothetical protein
VHVLSLALLATALASPDGHWRVALHARALAPGEPVRVVVTATSEVHDLALTFLDQAVALEPGQDTGTSRGWAAVPLDAKPGPGEVEVRWTETGTPRKDGARSPSRRAPSPKSI